MGVMTSGDWSDRQHRIPYVRKWAVIKKQKIHCYSFTF